MIPTAARRCDTHLPADTVPTRRHQVVVAGGGTAGWVAALAAARGGADVLLVERRHHLGGNLVSGLPILGFFNVDSQQIVRGIAEELVQRLLPLRGTDGHKLIDMWQSAQLSLEPMVVKSLIQEMLEDAGVHMLFASQVTDAILDGRRLTSIVVQQKSGREVIAADLFVDATGDAELAFQADAPVHLGGECDGTMQPPTLLVRLLDVNMRALRDYLKRHPQDFVTWRMKPGKRVTADFLEQTPLFLAFPRLLEAARAAGDFDATIDRVMFSAMPFDRSVCVNMLRPFGVDGTRSESITAGMRQLWPEVLKLERFFRKYVPGFQDCYAADLDPELLFRETRRIRGAYCLTAEDVLAGQQFADSIGLGGYYIDIHNPNDPGCDCQLSLGTYGIPYRCLLPQGVQNLLVAGRAISGTQAAAGSYRVMATCMAIGHAAGAAAALATRDGSRPHDLDVQRVRQSLQASDALVDWPPAGR